MLLDLGKRQAEEEDVPVGVESSELARPLYVKIGFRKYGSVQIGVSRWKMNPFLNRSRGRWKGRGVSSATL